MYASLQVPGIDSRAIDTDLETSEYKEETVKTWYGTAHWAADEISSILGVVSPLLENMALYERL